MCLGRAGVTAFHLGADGVKIDEPGFEQGASHGLQGLVHAPVQLDLVVQRAEDVRDGALFGREGDMDWKWMNMVTIQCWYTTSCVELS